MTGDRPKAWVQWLSLAEWWFNTTYHFASHLTPYQVVYGQVPPSHIHYIPGSSNIAAIDQWGQDREATLRILKEHLTQAQNHMKQQADKHRTERVCEVGDWVYLRLQPYKQTSLQVRSNVKLAPRFYGPFQVLKKIGRVAYRLNLPPHSKLHPVFHVSLLKKRLGTGVTAQPTLTLVGSDGVLEPQPVAILERRLVKYHGRPATQVLVQWSNSFPKMLHGSYITKCRPNFLNFCLGDKAFHKRKGMIRA